MNKSIWQNETVLPKFNKLEGDEKTNVLVIGGGLCGILTAYLLKQSGVDCIVIEANQIAGGTSGNTTAKITSLHGVIYNDLIEKFGIETANKYYTINQRAIKEFEKITNNCECDFEKLTAYTYSLKSKEKIEKEYNALKKLGANVTFSTECSLPFHVSAVVGLPNQAQFNPLKFINFIIKDLKIYENTKINEIKGNYAYYNGGKIKAQKFIVATHFPFIDKHGLYFLKLYQHRSYVIALENAQCVDGMYINEVEKGLSFRNYNNLLFVGGCGARTGKPNGNWQELLKFKESYYPKSTLKYKWATQDTISLDKIPLIGKYSKKTPNIYVATGFNKWGMTSSMVSAMLLTDMINNVKNDYADIFSPSRNILKPQLLINGFETASNFLLPTTKRCSHLGCALKWNKLEHSWDCSCHGSRFDENGKVTDNPANKNIKAK